MGSCDCSDYCDGAYPEFHVVSVRKARKCHVCCECGCTITMRCQYEHVNGKWDGKVSVFKICLICREIRNNHASCSNYGELYETLRECLGDDVA